MRRATLLLCALLAAAPASARVLVIRSPDTRSGQNDQAACERSVWMIAATISRLGGTADVVPASAVRTYDAARGTLNGVTYRFVVHANWARNGAAYTAIAGYNPDSLTLNAHSAVSTINKWADCTVPQLFLGYPKPATGTFLCNAAGDTTGIASNPNNATAYGAYYSSYAIAPSGTTPEVWKNVNYLAPSVRGTGSGRGGGINRAMVGMGVSAAAAGSAAGGATNYGLKNCIWNPTSGLNGTSDCDSVGYSTDPDTVSLWARYRSSLDTAPLIFCEWKSEIDGASSSYGEIGLLAMALAAADSASAVGSREFARTVGPLKLTPVLAHGFSRDIAPAAYASHNRYEGGGLCCRQNSDSSSANSGNPFGVGTMQDLFTGSHNGSSFTARPFRFALAFEPDSVGINGAASDASEKLFWNLYAPYIHYSPQPYAGTYAGSVAGARTLYNSVDVLGHTRVRSLIPLGLTSFTTPNVACTDTSSIYCGLKRMYAFSDSAFGRTNVDHVLFPPYSDWSPTTYKRTSSGTTVAAVSGGFQTNTAPGNDSLITAMYYGGVRGVAFDTEYTLGDVNASWDESKGTSATYHNPAAPDGFYLQERVQRVYESPGSSGVVADRMPFIGYRARPTDATMPASSAGPAGAGGHDWKNEFMIGALTGQRWFIGQPRLYYHEFNNGLRFLHVNVGALSASATDWGYQPGYGLWTIKWAVNEVAAINRFEGATVIEWDWPENVAAQILAEGMRK